MNTLSIKSSAYLAITAVAVVTAAMLLPTHSGPKEGSAATQDIVKLERVVIVGKRSDVEAPEVVIAQLPRVVITGRSTAATPDVQLASARAKTAAKAL